MYALFIGTALLLGGGPVAGVAAPIPAPPALMGSITGRVFDASTGEPLASAQVVVEGTNRGAVTAGDGRFTIANVPAGTYAVTATYIGYGTERHQNVRVPTGGTIALEFAMHSTPLRLQEVVVAGMTDPTSGVRTPFVVGRVTMDDVVATQGDALGALQGRVAGVTMLRGGGEPGADFEVMLRTPTSIMRDNSPMVVVDGVILGNASLRDIDGLDIESIEVVKGAAAASLYGSRAAAGVIEIRTRTGSHLGRGQTQFTLQTELGRQELPPDRRRLKDITQHHPYLVNGNGDWVDATGQVVDFQNRVLKPDRIADQPYKQTYDHYDAIARPGLVSHTTLSMAQNTDATRFYASVRNTMEEGVLRHSDGLRRRSVRLNLDHWVTSGLNLGMTGHFSRSHRDDVAAPSPFYAVSFMPPDVDLTRADTESGLRYIAVPQPGIQQTNPLYNQFYNEAESTTSRFIGGFTATYTPLTWFRLEGNLGMDRSDQEQYSFWPIGFQQITTETLLRGQIDRRHYRVESVTGGVGARVLHHIGDLTLRHHLRALYELEDRESTISVGRDLAVSGVKNLAVANDRQFSSNSERVRSEGYSAATGFDYADRLVGDLVVRLDGSSLFGPDDRWNSYYRASAAYRLAQHDWWPIAAITEFKPRFSIGTAGGRPAFADRFETWTAGSGEVQKQTLGNTLLRPEKATEREAGVDIIFWNRVSVQLTRAHTKIEDQILPIPLPSVVGYSHQWRNAGTLEGTTYEASIEAMLLSRPGRRWTANLVWDRSRHMITDFPFACYTDNATGTARDVYYRCAGHSLGSIMGQRVLRNHSQLSAIHANSHDQFQVNDDGFLVPVGAGNSWTDGLAKDLWGTTVTIDGRVYPWGEVMAAIDDEGNPLITQIGNTEPDFNIALGTRFDYGRLTVGALLDGMFGGTIYNYERRLAYRDYHADYDQAGKPDERKKPVDYYGKLISGTWLDYFLEDGTYLKLREIAASYRFDSVPLLERYGIRQAEVSLLARNLYTWTQYLGWDPEVGSLHRRIRDGDYPHPRTFTLGVRLDFSRPGQLTSSAGDRP
jgi:TonB-linked SusC/RagA family outer membrane protein